MYVSQPGKDEEWFRKYREDFQKLADAGDEDMKEILQEVEDRDDLKAWRS